MANLEERRIKARAARLKCIFGITQEQYDELFDKQNGCCAICERHRDQFKINFAVDHSHETGRIRGLLCYHCNHRLIGRHKDGDLLRKMADYVEGGTDWYVPERAKKPKKRKPRGTRTKTTSG